MDRAALKKLLLDVLERSTGETVGDVEETMNLQTDLGLDSIDFVTMAIEIQSECNIELQTAELKTIVLVKDLLDLLQAKLASSKNQAA